MAPKRKRSKPEAKPKATLGIVKNRSAAAHRMGLSTGILKAACAAGCPGFRLGGSIDCDAVKRWLDSNKINTGQSEVDYAQERALKTRIERKIREVELETLLKTRRSVEEFVKALYTVGVEIKSTLQFELLEHAPALGAGRDAAGVRGVNEAAFHRILKRWRDFAEKWQT